MNPQSAHPLRPAADPFPGAYPVHPCVSGPPAHLHSGHPASFPSAADTASEHGPHPMLSGRFSAWHSAAHASRYPGHPPAWTAGLPAAAESGPFPCVRPDRSPPSMPPYSLLPCGFSRSHPHHPPGYAGRPAHGPHRTAVCGRAPPLPPAFQARCLFPGMPVPVPGTWPRYPGAEYAVSQLPRPPHWTCLRLPVRQAQY